MLKDKQVCEAEAQVLIEPKIYEKKLNRTSMWRQKQKQKNQNKKQKIKNKKQNKNKKLGFLGSGLSTQEQAYVRIIELACTS